MPLTLLAAVLVASPPLPKTCSPDPPGVSIQPGGETYIRDAETAWAGSISSNEGAFLRRYTAQDFVAVFDGEVFKRGALIAGADERRPGAARDDLEGLQVHLFGSTAVAQGSEIWTETASGHRQRIVWSDLWVHCGGEWRLVTATSVGSPAE